MSSIAEYFNTAAYQQAETGTFRNSGRNSLRGFGSLNLDASAAKAFRISDRMHLQFHAQAFNAVNRANLNAPNSTVSAGTASFGKITGAASPRVLQFALRLSSHLWARELRRSLLRTAQRAMASVEA